MKKNCGFKPFKLILKKHRLGNAVEGIVAVRNGGWESFQGFRPSQTKKIVIYHLI